MPNSSTEHLINVATRHQLHLERLKAQLSREFIAQIDKTAEIVKQLLTGLEVDTLDQLNQKQLKALIADLTRQQRELFNKASEALLRQAEELAGYEADFEVNTLNDGFENIAIQSVAAKKAYQRARRLPIAATGELLEPFIKDLSDREVKRLNNTVRASWAQGLTVNETVRQLIGTKARRYKDGKLNITRRNAEGIVRTSIQHVSSTAREQVWLDNSDVLSGYKWVSTLDGRTSTQCRSLDGRIFEVGKGPKPPIHINCRSTVVAELDQRFKFLSEGRTRASKDGPISADLDYYDWLGKQSPGMQDSVLGAERGLLFRKGGLTKKRFAELQLNKRFEPLSLAEMRKLEPLAFDKAFNAKPLTKRAERAIIVDNEQQKAVENLVGPKSYKAFAGALESPLIKKRMAEYNLTQAEGVAIRAYTHTWYGRINNALRGGAKDDASALTASKVLVEALNKLPSESGVFYRKSELPKNVLDEHKLGAIVEYIAFTSVSAEKFASAFTGHSFVIRAKNAKDITWISHFNNIERERLFVSPTSFFISSIDKDKLGQMIFMMDEI